jgi:hypothetical protein
VPAELTPFSDGEGYMEHVWNGLSGTQVAALARPSTLARTRKPTQRALARMGLIQGNQDGYISRTRRGNDLIAWARETGRL